MVVKKRREGLQVKNILEQRRFKVVTMKAVQDYKIEEEKLEKLKRKLKKNTLEQLSQMKLRDRI